MILFSRNKYFGWYSDLILNAIDREVTGYVESHHIIPKSLGGSNTKNNLVNLTAREHYIAHLLLTKITSGKDRNKMLFAFLAMDRISVGKRYKSKLFEKLRIEAAQCIGNKNKENTEAHKRISKTRIELGLAAGINNPMYGRSAVIENSIKWYTNGEVDKYLPEGTEPEGFHRGRSSIKGSKNPLKSKEAAMKISKSRMGTKRVMHSNGKFTMEKA
jgi:hypothetical protein